ncbi:hypothetical protein NDU88_007991 [Pleurodeles waltl]|uniref:Uncharacterized protein n=1 Tax=Pleurodeles waltl TaxID=8319 RepID=A0AAV7VVY9_PLEWA|nr:hypothetical protein NDU88_007991 [Pleurodeles waltl]
MSSMCAAFSAREELAASWVAVLGPISQSIPKQGQLEADSVVLLRFLGTRVARRNVHEGEKYDHKALLAIRIQGLWSEQHPEHVTLNNNIVTLRA